MEIFILLLFVFFIVISLYDVKKHKQLNNRQKVNFTFLIFLIPFGGSLIYYLIKENLLPKK
jgi:prolipoprotein diacylglyceryltransferase